MTVYRTWYCNCRGKPEELESVETIEDEPAEPACRHCGATPSSDPRKTVVYRDLDSVKD